MFSAVWFALDRDLAKRIEQIALESKAVCIYRTMHIFPTPYELTRLLNTFSPDVVFLELEHFEEALLLARQVQLICPEAVLIGVAQNCSPAQAEEAQKAGVAQILQAPFTLSRWQHSLEQGLEQARRLVQDNLVAFLPAKAGSGATTVAVNLAGRLAQDGEQKVLLIEADLRSGLLSALLKLTADYSVVDALENASRLDGALWSRIVVKAHGLDLLVTPSPKKAPLFSWAHYHQLLAFARPRYDAVVVDLPEVINDATVEIVRRARRVFIVCTAEVPSLILTLQRREELRQRGIPDDRIGVILNRQHKHDLPAQDVEQFLRTPISALFQNDYPCVRRAIIEGRLIGPRSELGKAFTAFARTLLPQPNPGADADQELVGAGVLTGSRR